MATRCDADKGSTATWRSGPLPAPLPSGVRFSSHSASGISTTIAPNHSSGVQLAVIARQFRLRRRSRSLGVTMSVSRMPNLSFTTTTSPCAIR